MPWVCPSFRPRPRPPTTTPDRRPRCPPCQAALPVFPPTAVAVNSRLALRHEGDRTVYYHYLMPLYSHLRDDQRNRNRIVSQLVCLGTATVAELAAALDLSERTIYRAVKARRRDGDAAFDGPPARRGRSALTEPAQLQQAADLLAAGHSLRQVAAALGVSHGTVHRYRQLGLLPPPSAPPAAARADEPADEPGEEDAEAAGEEGEPPLPKAARRLLDVAAPLGRGALDVAGRVAASLGCGGPAAPRFQPVEALQHGGLLTALPALLQVGLLRFSDSLGTLPGYYGSASVLLLAAFMLLARVPNPERLRYQPPGEWGRLPGLDRCPTPDVLRRKIAALADPTAAVQRWRLALADHWYATDRDVRAALFFDGHVKVYTGRHRLARHFVSRQRLSLPAAAGFWANTPGGAPLLVLPQEVDPGLRRALWEDLLPELERMGLLPPPADPAPETALTLVFDREGWSPDMFLALKARGVACVTWIKGEQAERWPDAEFAPTAIPLRTPWGVETGRGQLAEHPLELADGHLTAREIRFWLDEREPLPGRSGKPRKARQLAGRPPAGCRQAALVTTHPDLPTAEVAGLLRSRWAQENVFKTMRQEFGLDTLPQHAAQEVDPARLVVNPAMRVLDKALAKDRREAGKRRREQAQLRACRDQSAPRQRAEVAAAIEALERRIAGLERARAATDSHVPVGELRPETLPQPRRNLWDGLRIIAYRAETLVAAAVLPQLGQPATVHSFVKALFQADATVRPDPAVGLLRVQLLPLATPAQDKAAAALCDQLNACRAVYPGTGLRLEYEILSARRRAHRPARAAGPPPRTHRGPGRARTTRGATAALGSEALAGRRAATHADPDTLSFTNASESGKSEVILQGGGGAADAAHSVFQLEEADYAWSLQIEPDLLALIAEGGKGTVVSAFATGVERLYLNQTNRDPGLGDLRSEHTGGTSPHPFLTDPVVSRALSLAIDRETLARTGYGRLTGRPTCNIWPAPSAQASTNNDECLVQNIPLATKILDDAGIVDSEAYMASWTTAEIAGAANRKRPASASLGRRRRTPFRVDAAMGRDGAPVPLACRPLSRWFGGAAGPATTMPGRYPPDSLYVVSRTP